MALRLKHLVERVHMTFSLLCLTVLLTTAGCRGEPPSEEHDYSDVIAFDTSSVTIFAGRDTVPVRVELALSESQKTMGLMERRKLDENAGMLFVYDSIQPSEAGFWMYRTRLPLDIAFLDSTGVIRAIRTMVPCETTLPQGCPVYTAGVAFRFALEVNEGFFQRRGIGIGDSVHLQRALLTTSGYAPSTPSP